MAPGYNHGTVYVSTVPVNPTVGEYLGGGKATLWALNAATGAPEWCWDEVQDLWGNPCGQLRRRPVVRAVVRRPGQHLHRRRQPRPALRHHELPAGEQPAGS